MAPASLIARRRRPPLHWKCAVSVRKRWHRLRRLWRPDREVEECRYFGAEFELAPNDVIGREIILKRFEWLQIPQMIQACRELKPAAFIDIGANFGLYTCIIGRQRLANRLIAFEPHRWARGRLQAHLELNGLTGVEIHDTALGAAHHTATLLPGAAGQSALSTVVASHPEGYEIEVVPLDDVLSFVGKPLVIKMDVEGYELEILEGAKSLLARNYGYAQIESFEERRASSVIDRMAQFGWPLSDHIVDDLIFRRSADTANAPSSDARE
jgi:FkbM family methyltransferase